MTRELQFFQLPVIYLYSGITSSRYFQIRSIPNRLSESVSSSIERTISYISSLLVSKDTVGKLPYVASFLILCILYSSFTKVRAQQIEYFQAAASPSQIGGVDYYTRGLIHFSDIDGDGQEELIGIDRHSPEDMQNRVSISRLTDGVRKIEWLGDYATNTRSVLVENIDDDPQDEVIVFGQKTVNQPGDTFQIIEWNGHSYQTTLTTKNVSARLGVMIDIEGDGVHELAITTLQTPSPFIDTDGHEPVTLNILKFTDSQPIVLSSTEIDNGVRAIATGDIRSDGTTDILTYQPSVNLTKPFHRRRSIDGFVFIYSIDAATGIIKQTEHLLRISPNQKRRLSYLNYFGHFKCANNSFLFYETKHQNWKSTWLFEKEEVTNNWKLVRTNLARLELFESAWQSSLAYSRELGSYAILRNKNVIRLVPKDHYHSEYGDKKCERS